MPTPALANSSYLALLTDLAGHHRGVDQGVDLDKKGSASDDDGKGDISLKNIKGRLAGGYVLRSGRTEQNTNQQNILPANNQIPLYKLSARTCARSPGASERTAAKNGLRS